MKLWYLHSEWNIQNEGRNHENEAKWKEKANRIENRKSSLYRRGGGGRERGRDYDKENE